MPLNIKNEEAHDLARQLAEDSGGSITEVVTEALREALAQRQKLRTRDSERMVEDLNRIALACAELPVKDERSASQILGYDSAGLPS